MRPLLFTCVALALPPLLHGCATAQAEPTVLQRALLHLQPGADATPTALRERLAQAAAMPVAELQPLAPGQWRLVLQCPAATGCADAWVRLAEHTAWVRAVEPDSRARTPRPPGRDGAR